MTATTPLHAPFASWGAQFLHVDGLDLPLRVQGAGIEYQAARENLALADGGDRGLVQIEGGDVLDFLQRMLSSDLRRLETGHGQWSALLDGKGHWITDLLLYRIDDGADGPRILMDCPQSRVDVLLQRIEMMHFGEQLSWKPLSGARLMLLGPQAGAEDFAVKPASEFGADAWWLHRPDRGVPCRELVAAPEAVREFASILHERGGLPTGWVVLDILRVEAGIPRWGTDFDGESILPETGEWQRASLAKGCYAGQEVVAKVDTYGQAPRQLGLLDFGAHQEPLAGAEILDLDGKAVGKVTSWVWSPLRDRAIGLGIVKRRVLQSESVELLADSGQERVRLTWSRPVKVPDRGS